MTSHGTRAASAAGSPAAAPRPSATRRHLVASFSFVALLHVVGFGLLLAAVGLTDRRTDGGEGFGLGLGISAYLLGMRHAFDADHIAAIDNTARKLMAEGQRPVAVGLWFSLGHSTVVLVLTALLAVGIRGLGDAVGDDGSTLQQAAGVIGPTVSGTFLVLVGVLNLMALAGILRVFRRMRHAALDEQELERHLASRGILNRVLGRATRAVRRPRHLYPVGLLFGLGFDTATEIALLAAAGGVAGAGHPLYVVLCLPILFAAGMTLLDTADGAFMTVAYGWAFTEPVRKAFYNVAVTTMSVVVALAVGIVTLAQVLAERLGLDGGGWAGLARLDLGTVGYLVTGLVVLTWVVALSVWHFGRIEERWTPPPGRG